MSPDKVFGIGLGKTGTSTLGTALEMLGYTDHLTCDLELTKAWKEQGIDPILKAAEGNNSFEDYPWPMVYKEVFERYPQAKFILTTRSSAQAWYQSLCKHSLRTGPTEFRKIIYGSYMPHDFEDEMIEFYESHNRNAKEFFRNNSPESLLELNWEKGDGWKELCEFLEKPIPREPFPITNQEPEKKLRRQPFLKRSLKKILMKAVEVLD